MPTTSAAFSVTVAPQLAESVQRVRRARVLRGEGCAGVRSVGRVALPVLQDTLDRSLALASAMDRARRAFFDYVYENAPSGVTGTAECLGLSARAPAWDFRSPA